MLKVDHLQMSFQGQEVIKDATFTLEPGDLVHITGPNGCGKSTLFKAITGIYQATGGKCTLGEKDEIGALIENPGFLEFADLKSNLSFLAKLKHEFDYDYTQTFCQRLGLDLASKQRMSKYSIGMRQKAGIIQAVMEKQNVILLDEPSRGLDVDSLVAFANLVNDLAKEGRSVVIASHDQVPGINYNKHYVLEQGVLTQNED